jgi:RimJ/RimL family protein N-acetyltransferase
MIRLLPVTADVHEALATREGFRERFAADVPHSRETARAIARQSLDYHERIGASFPWMGYFAIDGATNTVVGACGFKGGPDAGGAVEIAYSVFPEFEGRGHATASAHALYELACTSPRVRTVLAHTLPERNASCRVLEKCGFTLEGEVTDPEDGRVWRWRREAR